MSMAIAIKATTRLTTLHGAEAAGLLVRGVVAVVVVLFKEGYDGMFTTVAEFCWLMAFWVAGSMAARMSSTEAAPV
jgi:hypothetical protein